MKLDKQIHEMLTQSTGTNLLDSGGENGRHWQTNQLKTLEDFQAEPSATVEVYLHKVKGVVSYPEFLPCASVFHLLTNVLELDDLCQEFNTMDCDGWNGDYLGTSAEQCEFLEESQLTLEGEPFNTCNHSNALSQGLWGAEFKDLDDQSYVLLSIHNGADVRGGYTDAKLFKLKDYKGVYSLLDCNVSVSDGENYIDISWDQVTLFDVDGYDLAGDDEQLLEFAKSLGEGSHLADAYYLEL